VSSKQTFWWQYYLQNGAYLNLYHQYLKRWDREQSDLLNHDLGLIFSHLQCLPMDPHNHKQTTVIWQAHQNQIQFIANPKFYPIAKIGKSSKSTKTTQKAQLPGTVIECRLFEEKCVALSTIPIFFRKVLIYQNFRHGHGSFKPPRQNDRNRSARALNKHNPPPRKKALDNGHARQEKGQEPKCKTFISLASKQCLGVRKHQKNLGENGPKAEEMEGLSTNSQDYSDDLSNGSSWPLNGDKEDKDKDTTHIIYRFDNGYNLD